MLRTITAGLVAAVLALLPLSRPVGPGALSHPGAARALAAPRAKVLQAEGFESRTFTAGQPLDGQGGWLTIAGRDAVLVTDEVAHSGQKGVVILGSQLEHTQADHMEAFAGRYILYDPLLEGTPIMHLRVSVRLDGPDTSGWAHPDLACANWYTATTAGENLGAMHVCTDGRVYASAGGGPSNIFSTAYTRGTFVDLDLVLDFTTGTTRFVVDGLLLGSAPMYPEPLTTTEIIAAPFELNISRVRMQAEERALVRAYFDDYEVTVGSE